MKYASDFRAEARAALKNHWGIAILATVIAGFLGGQSAFSGVNFDLDQPPEELPEQIQSWIESANPSVLLEELLPALRTLLIALIPALLATLMFSVVLFLIGPCIHWGLCRFRLMLLDGQNPSVGVLFSGFKNVFLKALGLQLLVSLIIFAVALACVLGAVAATAAILMGFFPTLGIAAYVLMLAFVIAAIIIPTILGYRYSMSFYALVDNPDLGALDAMRESVTMMKGNKWRLFCLQLSFIGWSILCLFTCGIGSLWLTPYVGQAEAAFYHEVSRRAAVREAVEELGEFMQGL